MAVIGNGLGILGWANNGGRGWTSTGVMWETCMRSLSCSLICDYFAMMIRSQLEKKKFLTGIVAERQVFMLENYLKAATWTSVFWDHLGDCCNFISHGILQFMPDFLHLPYKLCQMQPPFSASVYMYKLEVLKTSALSAQCPHLCTILWRLLNHVQDVNGSIRRNQFVTENAIHLTNHTFQQKETNVTIMVPFPDQSIHNEGR